MTEDLRHEIGNALGGLAAGTPLRSGTAALLGALGYQSERTLEVRSVEDFLEGLDAFGKLTEKQRTLFEPWQAVDVVFQFTGKEIDQGQAELFDVPSFDASRIESFLFLAVGLNGGKHSRTQLAETTRTVNRLFKMPVIVLFRYGSTLTLAAIHRRAHRRDHTRDVLEKVTLVKDIRAKDPHRAHVDILADLALTRMFREGVRTFDKLHSEWEKVLDIESLNRRFYRDLFAWFERAVAACRFPDDGVGEGSEQRHVIRLITRLLFVWFMKEKGLIPDELFEEGFARRMLRDHSSDGTAYYRAVLQNLFFATLNTEIDKRGFSKGTNAPGRGLTQYRYRKLLASPDDFVKSLKQVPFVNGGLFDCLDDFVAQSNAGRCIDAFTDIIETQGAALDVPAHLFFDPQDGLFPLFGRYKFTVEENTPLDREVALDPELLGRVFENLLAAYNPETRESARKSTGSYYTPRPVVDYMVREVLTEALATKTEPEYGGSAFWRDRLQYLLDHSDAMDDADELFDNNDKRTVVDAIAEISVLDPAVGSGAFPMGVLQALTLALRRLDPDNALWEEFQKKRAKARAGKEFDNRDSKLRDEALREISATFDKYRATDFGRKLYLIQNSIYGADIQPIACQIAKLRFFISLVIEQESDRSAPNLGIRPLPNLETRFVAADVLLGLDRPAQIELGQTEQVAALERQLTANRERHFHAGDRSTKLRLRDKDSKLRIQLANELQDVGFGPGAARNIANWNPYDQNAHADWFDPEYMFGVREGFDVVIGNPPYIQLQKEAGRARKRYEKAGYETFASTGDIYQLFYERAFGLLRSGTGTLAFITSNSWLKAEYGRGLRSWFATRHTPLSLIEMGKDVFDAIVDTAVLIVRTGKEQPVTCSAVDVGQASDDRFVPPKGDWGTLEPRGDQPWMALSSVERTVMEKMEAVGTPLRDWDISIYRGILTGYNNAFIVDTAVCKRLIAEDPASRKLLKPILRGRDIARYRANWANRWLISTFPSLGLDIDEYPAVKRHLLEFGKQRLAQNGRLLPQGGRARKKTPHDWFELQDTCAYHERFTEEKLFWMDLTPKGRFSYAPAGTEMYCANSVYFMHGPMMKRLAAFLNSSLITWYVNKTSVTSGLGTARWFAVTVETIPIPSVLRNGADVEGRVNDLMMAIDHGATERAEELDCAIEHLVFEAYGITQMEREAIANAGMG